MISVVIPIYNGEQYLKMCVQSVIDQQYTDWELIISDDNSSDKSLDIVRQFNDNRITVVSNSTGRGIFQNLNNAIRHSGGDYIQIFNQDDVMEPSLLARQLNCLNKWPSAGMVFCKKINIDETGEVIVTKTAGKTKEYQALLPELISSGAAHQYFTSFGCFPGNLSPVMISRKAWLKCGVFNVDYAFAGDFEYWVRLSSQFDIVFNNEYLCKVRSHGRRASQVLSEKDLQLSKQLFIIGHRLLEKYTSRYERKAARRYIQRTMGAHSFHQLVLFLTKGRLKVVKESLYAYKGMFSPVLLMLPYVRFVLLKQDIKQYPIFKK